MKFKFIRQTSMQWNSTFEVPLFNLFICKEPINIKFLFPFTNLYVCLKLFIWQYQTYKKIYICNKKKLCAYIGVIGVFLCVCVCVTTSKSLKLFRKHIWNENVHISNLTFFCGAFWSYPNDPWLVTPPWQLWNALTTKRAGRV